MSPSNWSSALERSLSDWLSRTLSPQDVEALVPPDDPLRTWWTPEPRDDAVARLVTLLCGGNEHLSLLALVQRARSVSAPPASLERLLAAELAQIASTARHVEAMAAERTEAFFSYAHEDTERAVAIRSLLRAGGLRVFRDVERIRPGESITTRLTQVMSTVDTAVLIVSRHSLRSEWVERELAFLLKRREREGVLLLPVLVDDIPLPASIEDLFTIDLRDYSGQGDDDWAALRLQPLIDAALGLPANQDDTASR